MKSNIFIPERINVGFQKRENTYTGKLAYVIYYDNKGVLRKETSWESWREKEVPNEIYENKPLSGFVLNKKVGGYATGWNHRNTYVRVYDPRGFELELSVPNLLYILENTNSIKGKGLEGEFVYGYAGTELLLIPTMSPDYQELTLFNDKLRNKKSIKAKELIIGATYLTKANKEQIYIGRFDYWERKWEDSRYSDYQSTGLRYVFANKERIGKEERYGLFDQFKSISGKFIDVVSAECHPSYADIFEKMECCAWYSPLDESKNVFTPMTFEEFLELGTDYSSTTLYSANGAELGSLYYLLRGQEGQWYGGRRRGTNGTGYYKKSSPRQYGKEEFDLERAYKELNPHTRQQFLKNGKPYEY